MSTLIIPIHLDALYLKAPKEVIGAKADFSRLPYFNKEKKIDVNSDIANISENVLSQPFQSHSLQLEAGFHLHWALPDLLTAGKLEKNDKGEKLVYPNVPDRWLITRINGKNQKQWVVESNFLQKEGSNNMEDGISFPLSDHERGSSGQPFRYMGRQIDLSEKDTLEGTHQYYGNLTALGYGDPSFGAFYPECHSVFGCHDPLNETLAGTIEYEVIGWYNRPEQDYFAQTLIEINNSKEVSSLKGGEKTTAIAEALLNNLNISAELSDNLPTNLLCYGRLILEDGILKNTQDTLPTIEKIAIGNTATEALSALLNDKDINKEKQLEAIRLMSKIGTQRLDLNAKFEEAFHDNGFSPIDGGSVWTITMRKTSDKKDQNTPAQFDANLPELFAHHLNILNNFQQQFDRATDELRDLKQQLFSDWYKFMVSGNHPYIHKDELSDPDEIRFFIENNSIVELKKKSDQREKLLSQDNHKGEIWKASEQVKKDNDNFNTGRIPKHKQGRNFNNNELFFTADESKGSTLGLHLNGDIQEISFETFQNEAVEVRAPNAAIFIKLNEMHHELADDALALTNLQAGLKQAYLNQADLNQVLFDLNQVMADLKQAKAISLWVKIDGLNSSEKRNLIQIENEDQSEIGPAGVGSFWKSVYIDGQKTDPYTLHKWLEIPKDQWIHIYLEAGESFTGPIILMENFSKDVGGVRIASIRVMKQNLTEDERAYDRNETIKIKGPYAAIFIKNNEMPHKLLDDAQALTNLQADLDGALADLKQSKAISLWVKINSLNSSENFNLIHIENEDHSEIGPAGIGSFWKSVYIDGQKMDPYTLHKWLEIPKDQWIHIYLEAGESFIDPIILTENFSAGGSFASIVSIASIEVMKQTLTADGRAHDRNKVIEIKGPNAAVFITLNDMPEKLPDDALAFANLQADLKQACLNQALVDLKQAKAISLWVKINGLNSSEDFNLIRIENEDHSEIGPTGIGSFWKSMYIDGQKMDPYTLHKWLEIPKDQWIHIYLEAGESFADPIILMENFSAEGGGSFDSIASIASIRVMKQTLTEDERACDRNIFRQREYKLEKGAAPRYWQANEPVIMMSGPACEPSQRHGFDGKDQEDNKLKCYISELDSIPNESTIKVLVDNQDLKSFYNEHFDKYLKWTAQPWNPIMLDWEVEIFPLQKNDENDIINHFTLQDHHPDLTLTSANNHFEESGVIFSGNTLLSPHAKIKVLDAINNYLENPNHKKSAVADSINAQKEQIEKGHFLSQAFSGFNAAMLMHKQTMQLPIDDPLAFEDYSDFSQKIKELVGDENKWAPMPENPFSPIRAGKIKVLNLRLIDSFGRHVDAPVEKNTIHSHAFPTAEDMAVMLPRITQPTRLNLRWISANRDELEMNSHPESSPICGWILPNNLDNSMMIYDQSGDLLGLIDQKGIWKEGPGNQNKISINHIPNKHLRQVVLSLEKDSADFLKIANKTLEKIDPESFAQHLDLALLMGRPIAIVRASLNLELKGRTAVNQSWDLFTKDIEDETYDTEGFEKVRFPIRLGEPGQFNDGVIGFWKDEETKGPFHATISVKDMNTKEDFENEEDRDFDEEPDRIENSDTSKDTETIHYYKNGKPNIAVSIADAPQTFTMLIDPRAKVHVVSGIQPTKVINLPPDQYMDALRRIDIFFMASPILCPKGRIALPLPIEPGFEWSWISKQKTTWSEITKTGRIDKHKVLDAFPNGQNLWDDLVLQKWIDPLDGFTANIVTKNERKSKTLSTSTAPMTDKIEFMLNQCMIIPPDYAASFKDKSDIREGWLKLSHNTKNRL